MAVLEEYSHFFTVKVELFDGPIDLLLHLVKQRELPIEKVSLAEVASQYLGCVEAVRHIDLDVAGEYLVIAATLLSIKASVLLNQPVELIADEDGNLIDPHDELLRRLREAEVYKEGAERLHAMDLLGVDVFEAPSCLHNVPALPAEYRAHDPMLLGKAFRRLLEQLDGAAPLYTVMLDSVSVLDRMMGILDTLRCAGSAMAFESLITDRSSRAALVASFVALLELCKRQAIRVEQRDNFETIFVVLAADKVDLSDTVSEFDQGSGDEERSLAANAVM
jgi:segregation and condensation protein A